MQAHQDRSATSDSGSIKIVELPKAEPREMIRGVAEDEVHGVFGKNAVIWTLNRTQEIGLSNGKPRKMARLIVVKNEHDKTARKYLLKRLPYRDEKRRKRFLREIEAHRHVCSLGGSRYISRFYGARDCIIKEVNGRPREGKLDYVMELGSGGDILSWVQGRWTSFSRIKTREKQEEFLRIHIASVQRIIAQVAFAVNQCFDARIVHFDLKLENVVMTKILPDEKWRYQDKMEVDGIPFHWCIKLIDFGLARHFPNDWLYRDGRKGTPRYMAPEIAESRQNIQDARNADIWPIGVMLWECLTGMPLWKEARRTTSTYMEMIKSGGFKRWFKKLCNLPRNRNFSQFVPSEAVDMLNEIFSPNADSRLTIDQMVKHKFLESQMPEIIIPGKLPSGTRASVLKNEEKKAVEDEQRSPAASKTLMAQGFALNQNKGDEAKDFTVESLTQQEAGEVLLPRVQRREACRARYVSVVYWFKTWSLYSLIIVAYVVAAPFWLEKSGFWDFHAYWSIFAAGLPLILGLFLYHARRGLNSSPKWQISDHKKITSTAWDVGMKPLVTELSQLSSFAVAMMWINNKSWTNEDEDDESGEYTTKMNGYAIFISLIAYRILSSLFFYLRAREMERGDDKQRPKVRIGLSQLFCLRLYWDVEKACQLRRQTTAIREHKILEGVLNSFIFLVVSMYYYFEKSVGADNIEEASWLIFAGILAMISVALVLNMGDVLGISVKKTMWWRDMILIAFRMADVAFRVGAYAVFAACVSTRNTIYIFAAEIVILSLLSYLQIITINTNRFEFEKEPGAITKMVKTVLSSVYGIIACPLLHMGWYWYPVKVLHDGALIFASWQFQDENVVLWDEDESIFFVFGGTGLFFVLGLMSYLVIDWDQYNKILRVKDEKITEEDEDLISRMIEMCKTEPELLSRFLVSGVLRVSSVKARAVRGWNEYTRIRSWLLKNGFYDLIENEENPLIPAEGIGMERTRTYTQNRSDNYEEKAMGPQDIKLDWENKCIRKVNYSNDLVSYSPETKVLCMSVSPDGDLLAIGLEDKPYLEILKLPSMTMAAELTKLREFNVKRRFLGAVTGVAFTSSGNDKLQLVTISEDARLRIFDVTTGTSNLSAGEADIKLSLEKIIDRKTADLKKSTYKIRCLAVATGDAKNFAVGVEKYIWLLSNGKEKVERRHDDEITAIKFFPNESMKFVTGSKDKTVRIWNQSEHGGDSSMTILNFGSEWRESIDTIRTVDVNSNGTAIACGCINGVVIVWEKRSDEEWKVNARIKTPNGTWVNAVNFLPMTEKSEDANRLIIHTRPQKTIGNQDDELQNNGYSALVNYKNGKFDAFIQPKWAVESSCIFKRKEKLKLLTGSWTDKDKHRIILWDVEDEVDEK